MAKVIALSGDVGWEISANKIRSELKAAKGKDVEFHVNSPGGFVSEGIEIFNVIRGYKGHTTAVITGVAASMASYFILACDKVVAYDNTIYMIHNPWSLATGDYNDMGKAFEMLKGMASLLAKEYAKKTGALVDKMQDFMDAETFFFGDEMKSEGFVDEILEAPEDKDDDDKASAITKARASMDNCLNRMRESEAANDDFQKAVAYVDSISLLLGEQPKPVAINQIVPPAHVGGYATDTNALTPAGAGNKKQEDKKMTFKEFLESNPAAKAEYDVAMAKAFADGKAESKTEIEGIVAKVSPILTSPDYDEKVKAFGAEVITGKKTLDGFEAIVFMKDQEIEAAKAKAAKEESEEQEETPGAPGSGTEAAEAAASFDAKLKDTPVEV
jgi:ATP-dependent Clp endopeptidase proteolytic subunit ClpP